MTAPPPNDAIIGRLARILALPLDGLCLVI